MSKRNRKAKYDLYSKEAPDKLSDALKKEFGTPKPAKVAPPPKPAEKKEGDKNST